MFLRGRALGLMLVAMLVAGSVLAVADAVTAAGGISYAGRLGTASATTTSTSVTVKTSTAATAGGALVVSVMLGGTGTGTVTASDSSGVDTYTTASDHSDGKNDRLLVLSALNQSQLSSGTTVTVTYPSASTAFVAVDDFSGVGAVGPASASSGSAGTFNSGSVSAVPGQMLYGVAAVQTKQSPSWNSGWTALSAVGSGSRRLGTAYQAPASAGSYSASGKTNGNVSWIAAVVAFSPPDSPPNAKLSVTPATGVAPLAVKADASGSTDTDLSPISTYTFDFGDGTTVGPQSSAVASHTYSGTGTFNVIVTVTDTAGKSSTATATVTVNPEQPPVAQLSVPSTVVAGTAVRADATGSNDPDGTAITYTFDFGDGTKVGPQSSPMASHTYSTVGQDTVTVTVTDTAGLTATASSVVTVNDAPPTAKLSVSPASGVAPLAVTADASGSADADGTAITYTFNFGDGTTVGPQTTPTASHTYSAPGPYTVTVTVTDTASLTSTATATVNATTEQPPVAHLSVSPTSGTAPLKVTADGTGSADPDGTAIRYTFNFGDGTTVGPQSTPTAPHSYSSAGNFNVVLTVTDTAGNTATASATVTVSTAPSVQTNVYAGYYDTHHANTNPKPSPWSGSANVVFEGTPDSSSGGWDTSAMRIDNVSGTSLAMVSVTVDIGSDHFALWNTTSLGPGQSLIAAQTAFENFDGSDLNPAGCYGCAASTCTTEVQSTVPVVHVTVNGVTTNYPDPGQILNTHGVDSAGCPYTGTRNDESESWQQLASGP